MKEQIQYTTNISHSLRQILEKVHFSKVAVLVDENTARNCLPLIPEVFKSNLIEIESGEANKNLQTCNLIWSRMTEMQLDRKSLLINLGGGVITDMGAFCASTFKRGIRYLHIPTTLLAMTDAAIGGKTGVNFKQFKNHIGLFSRPETILIDPVFLESLDQRQKRSGYAEVLKHAIISGEPLWSKALFEEQHAVEWLDLIELSSSVKMEIVANDFKENGIRKALNFGHSIGHQLESFSLNAAQEPVLHGEAIAAGMMVEAQIAGAKGLLSSEDLKSICARISSIFEPASIGADQIEWIRANLIQDKKNEEDKLIFVLPEKIGKIRIDIEVGMEDILMAIDQYNNHLL